LQNILGRGEVKVPNKQLIWDDSLAIGVDVIDIQHRELIDRIGDFRQAMSKGQTRSEVGKMMAFLEQYVVDHFGTEEKLMKRRKYTDYVAHRQEHLNFTTELTVKKTKYEALEQEGAILSFFAVELERWLSDWFASHITQIDKVLGEFLIRQQSSSKQIELPHEG
jgi:hemerythrin